MIKLHISNSPYRMGVLSVVFRKDFYHFSTKQQAMTAISKVNQLKSEEEISIALEKLCGEDYFSSTEEFLKFKGIHSSISMSSTSTPS